jgi:hypothetical protein
MLVSCQSRRAASRKGGKDGNPLEVRMIASPIMNASGIFTADKTVK